MKVTLNTLVNFNGTNGSLPFNSTLIADAHGDLFGTTSGGGANGLGSVFEIAKGSGHITTLVSFNGTDGAHPVGSLTIDANGNLFGTTFEGGASNQGTVFGIAKTASGYASTPTTLVSFNGTDGANPKGGVIMDANGDLFGTTVGGGANGLGTVFEIIKTGLGYASTPTTLVSFNDGSQPAGGLIMDANGDLFGTTQFGGNGFGTVFEILKFASGYANIPATLAIFNGTNGAQPVGSLIFDASGDLFGTTAAGGASNQGTVFGIATTAPVLTLTTLVSFNGTDGDTPGGSLIMDANGDLFGTTPGGGASNDGTVFEITKTAFGYASTPTTLVSFNGTDGAQPLGGLFADAHGNLFGTTGLGGANNDGTVFQITGNGFFV